MVTWRYALPALAVFLLAASPALYGLALQHGALAERRVLGMQVSAVEGYAHANDWILGAPQPVTSSYGVDNIKPQEGYGTQFLPLLRGDWRVASLHTDLFESGYAALKGTALQYVDDPGYTLGYFLPEQGYLYIASIPLTLLGMLVLAAGRRRQSAKTPERSIINALLLCWIGAAALFCLTHLRLSLPHYAALFYPLLLCTALGVKHVASRLRGGAVMLLALYIAGLGMFVARGYDPAPAFPGLQEALAYTEEQGAPRVAVTTRLYPHDAPGEVAALEVIWAYGLNPSYAR
jgi:hypothetical protein